MKSSSFSRLFASLVGAFKRYHDTPRSPAGIPRLARARQDLDEDRARKFAVAEENSRYCASPG